MLSFIFIICFFIEHLIRIGGDLLSHVLRRSTIGAVALNGRVRDGTGCFAHAVTTNPNRMLIVREISVVQASECFWCV